MIKVNLQQELESTREKAIAQANSDELKEVKLLLANNTQEEKIILQEAGLYTNMQKVEKTLGIDIQRKKLEEEFGTDVKIFTEEEIKGLCIKYNLRLLQSNKFKGYIEPQLGAKIRQFFTDGKIGSIAWEAKNKLFIMAPPKAFNLEERPEPPRDMDPALFYKMETTEGVMYALIHKWGKDFTVWRRIGGIFRRNSTAWITFKSLMIFSTILLGLSVFKVDPTSWALAWVLPLSMIISFIHTAIVTPEGSNGIQEYEKRFNEESWNSIFKN